MSIYIYYYGYTINLTPQSTLANVAVVRNTLGIIQSLYNFIEASPKRHAVFQDFDNGQDESLLRSLKLLSVIRWSCHWEAVKSVYEQSKRIVGFLLQLSEKKDSKTHTDCRDLLKSMLNLDFIFRLCVLRFIPMNTNDLNIYIQGKKIDIAAPRKNASMTIKTLKKCMNDDDFNNLWETTVKLCKKLKNLENLKT